MTPPRRTLLLAALLAAPLAATLAPRPAGALDVGGWAFRAPIELPPGAATAPLVELALPPAVLAVLPPGAADLRVVTDEGREVPYVLTTDDGHEGPQAVPVQLSDRAWLPGTSASVVLDFGPQRPEHAALDVVTAGTDFRRRVRVEARDDPAEPWQLVRDGALLFRVAPAAAAAAAGYERSAVPLPPGHQRFLRVTVERDVDDPERLAIEAVQAWSRAADPPETAPVAVAAPRVSRAPEGRATWLDLDLGQRGLPLHALTLDVAEPDFFRPVTALGRDVAPAPAPAPEAAPAPASGAAGPAPAPEPWAPVAAGVVYRFTAGGAPEESLTLPLGGARFRHLRLRIEDRDDAPLTIRGARVTRRVPRIGFRPVAGERYALYVGNPHAAAPSYDLAHFADRLRGEGVGTATAGPLAPNPAWGRPPAPEEPWSERHGGLLWAALLLALGVLGLLVWRQVRQARRAAAASGGPRPGEDG